MNTEQQIQKLLGLRLTKFEYGFCLGLQGHEPSPQQQKVITKMLNRHSLIVGMEGNYEQPPYPR